MHFLLDTHILLWTLYCPEKLPRDIRNILEHDDSDIEYSIVSLWEIELKHSKYEGEFLFTARDTYQDAQISGLHMMELSPSHIITLGRLNKPKKDHKDPFDRMLIAQSKFTNSYLITHDRNLTLYEEDCVRYF